VRFAVAWPRHVERVLSGDRSLAEDKRKRACPPGEASLALVDQAHLAFVRRSALARSGAPDEASPAQRPGALGVCQAICACPIRRNRRGLACSETRRHLALVRRSALARLGAPGEASLAQRPGALGVCQAICACPITRILEASPAQRPGALGVCQAIRACPIRRTRRGLACSETRRTWRLSGDLRLPDQAHPRLRACSVEFLLH
jgi:hypothetical protein